NDHQQTVEMMVEYTKLVRQWGKGVPICIDSRDEELLIAALKEWYNTDEPVRPPLLNSIKTHTADSMMPLKKTYDFSFVGLLADEDKPVGSGSSSSVDKLFETARVICEKAMSYGFKPEEIFFDLKVLPLAVDKPTGPGVLGHTYLAFETIRKIKNDPAMKRCHCTLRVTNSGMDLPGRRLGIVRAYVAKAMEYGMDAAILNVSQRFGEKSASPELIRLVDAFAKLNGNANNLTDAMTLLDQFCTSCKRK
ncbi:MAG: dihydropteroate synthase, partial [Planctomycetota bacterium]